MSDESMEFTPETLRALAYAADKLRTNTLFNLDAAGADPTAEQHYLLALAALDQALRHFTLAALLQSQAIK